MIRSLIALIFLLAAWTILGCQRHPNYVQITLDTDIYDTIKNYQIDRGIMVLERKYTIKSWCPIASENVNSIWLHYRSRNEKKLTLSDIKPPFIIVKNKGKEYFKIIKDKATALILLVDY